MIKHFFSITILLLSFSINASEIGRWYDDNGSPTYFDATFIISEENGNYYISRINGDGSKGKYRAEKNGKKFIKINDKFGAYYIITKKGLTLNDQAGYIRTAKKIE
tara:strand:+ start:677 stop:994 length:318 start_codon:yes stop_codon:yes gene_type:complete